MPACTDSNRAFQDVRFYSSAFTAEDAAAYAALYPVTLPGFSNLDAYAYVQSYGVNGVDTGIYMTDTDKFTADFAFTDVSYKSWLCGAGMDANKQTHAIYLNGSKRLAWTTRGQWWWSTWPSAYIAGSSIKNTRLVLTVESSLKANLTYYDTRATKSSNVTGKTATSTGPSIIPTHLFRANSMMDNDGQACKAKLYSFEVDANSSAVTPRAFFAPTTDGNGAAGFTNVVAGTFHGECLSNPSTALTFTSGVGRADDYRYRSGKFYSRIYASSSDSAMGLVKFDGGEAAGTNAQFTARGRTAKIIAVPAEGYMMDKWVGDTWAITDGSQATTNITVKSGTAIQLRATFVAKSEADALLTVPADGAGSINWSAADWRDSENPEVQIPHPTDKNVTIVAHKSFTLTLDLDAAFSNLTIQADANCVVTLVKGAGSLVTVETIVESGVLKLGSDDVLGKTPKVTVKDGGTFDINGMTVGDGEAVTGNVVTEFRIAGAGAGSYPWAFTSSADMTYSKNVGMLYLDADATIGGAKALWIGVRDSAGWNQDNKNMNLGGHALAKTGSGDLNIRRPYSGTGGGTIDVQAGTLRITDWSNADAAYGESCVSNIALVVREGTTVVNEMKNGESFYTLYFNSLDVRNATMTSSYGAFGVLETLSGCGSIEKLAMGSGAAATLDGNLTIAGAFVADGALSLTRAAGVETNVTVAASGTLTASGAISVGAGVIFDVGVNRPEGTLSFDGNATLALRKASITNEVIVLNASSRPQNIVVCDVDGATVIADPVVTYDAGVLTISVPTPVWSNIDGTGSFDSAENWSGNVPQPGESFIVNLSGDTLLTLGGSLTPSEIRVAGSGTLAIFSGSHTFSESNVSAESGAYYFVCAGTSENSAVWIGGPAGNLGDAAKWSTGVVPGPGTNAVITSASEAALTNSAAFKASSIMFPSCSAAVTINGDGAITGIAAITNLSSASHVINVPVYFEGDIQVKQAAMAELGDVTKAHVTFAGGAYAAPGCAIENGNFTAVYSRCMFGEYHLASTESEPWSASFQGSGKRICLGDNSALHVPCATNLTELYVGNGAKVDVGEVAMAASGRVSWHNYGEIVVTNMTLSGAVDRFTTYDQGTSIAAVFKFDSVTTEMTGNWFYFADGKGACKSVFYFGAGGLNFSPSAGGSYCFGKNAAGESQTVRPWYSDFTIADRGNGAACLMIQRDVIFCTDDESGVGRTITMDAITSGRQTGPAITVSGSGTLRVNKAAINNTQPTVKVKDTATLAYKPGASLTTSTTTVNVGATLQVAESGTVALGGGLTLADGAALGFNFTDKNTAPVLNVTGKTVTVNGTVNVKVSSADGVRPKGGDYTLTSGEKFAGKTVSLAAGAPKWARGVSVNGDGDIVLKVKRAGFVVIVK